MRLIQIHFNFDTKDVFIMPYYRYNYLQQYTDCKRRMPAVRQKKCRLMS